MERDRRLALEIKSDILASQRRLETESLDEIRIDAELVYVQDDCRRRILGEKEAGWDSALSWLDSPYDRIQDIGVQTLQQIGTPGAVAKLEELTRREGRIAKEAQFSLDVLQRAEPTRK